MNFCCISSLIWFDVSILHEASPTLSLRCDSPVLLHSYTLHIQGTLHTEGGWIDEKSFHSSQNKRSLRYAEKIRASPRIEERLFLVEPPLDSCHWKFDHYAPSAWEKYWSANITDLQQHVCESLSKSDQLNNSIRMIQRIIALQKSLFNVSTLISDANDLFSHMVYRMDCSISESKHLVRQQIEPLIGLLRDPLTICWNLGQSIPAELSLDMESALQSKRFLLLAPSAPYFNLTPTSPIAPWIYTNGSRKILFDIGCAFFNHDNETTSLGKASSTRWFYNYFREISLRFDRVIAFEKEPLATRTVWEQIPDDLMGVFTFVNTGIETKGKFNPWQILASLVKPEDYVIVKLDIDTNDLERDLMQQIVNNQSLYSLIDEMFFEMHVFINDMAPYWGSQQTGKLKDTYDLFFKLRQLGIRMHSWP